MPSSAACLCSASDSATRSKASVLASSSPVLSPMSATRSIPDEADRLRLEKQRVSLATGQQGGSDEQQLFHRLHPILQ